MSLDEYSDDANCTIKFPKPKVGIIGGEPSNTFVNDYVQEQLKQVHKHLEDAFVTATIAKLTEIYRDDKHPAHPQVRRLLLEVKNAPTSTR